MRAGFTLIEVMVAVAILALSLSAIFSSEAGAARMAHRSHKMGIAALLARCKMGEIEEQIASEGLPAVFDSGSDACCEDATVDGFACDWEIHPVLLPDAMFETAEGQPGADPGAGPAAHPSASNPGDPTATPFGDIGQMQPQDLLSGGADIGGIGAMALQYAYPILKPSFESQIRRATVTVRWKEGSTGHDLDVTQYVVAEEPVQVLVDGQGNPVPGAGPAPETRQ